MIASTEKQDVIIQASGMNFLRLKTEIYKRIGKLSSATNNEIRFPISCIPLLADLLSVEAKEDEAIKSSLTAFVRHAQARDKAISVVEENQILDLPEFWLTTLDPPQAVAVSAMTTPGILGLCLFDEQGSGKTVMSIAAFDILKEAGVVDALIVVCPKSMVSEWPKDFNRFLGKKYTIVQAEGDKSKKYEAAMSDFDVLVTNYEGVDVMLTSLIAFSSKTKYLLVIDESYYLKNGDSERSDKVSRLRNYCTTCFVLCGTPAPNSAHDLINQFDLADLGFTFGGFSKSSDPIVDWDKISSLVDSRGLFIRRLKTEILENVPEKNFHIVRVPLQGRQDSMYKTAKTELELELRSLDNETFKKNLTTYFQRRSVLLQICCCPTSIDPTFAETGVKYTACDKIIEDLTSKNRKVIIWSNYTRSIDELMIRYSKFNPVRVDGKVSTPDRRAAVKSFQEDPNVHLFIGNPAAAGAGITLHSSFDAIYISYSNQAAHFLQSLDRIHRRGQSSDHVNYYLIVCEETIEEPEIIRLRQKEVTQHNLLGDHIPWPTSLDDALQELAS